MKAILDASGGIGGVALREVLGRPAVVHAIESLTRLGASEVTVLLCEDAAEVEAALGDGAQWGLSISTELLKSPADRDPRCRQIARSWDAESRVLLGSAQVLTNILDGRALPSSDWAAIALGGWTGWASVTARRLQRGAVLPAREVPSIRVRSFDLHERAGQLAANLAALDAELGLLNRARSLGDGIWVAAGASISPAAQLKGPLYIGPGTLVAAGASLGPGLVVGANCQLNSSVALRRSVIESNHRVGDGVFIEDTVVAEACLLTSEAQVLVRDSDLIEHRPPEASPASEFLRRGLAGLLALALLPLSLGLALALWLRRGRALRWREMIVRANSAEPELWPRAWIPDFGIVERSAFWTLINRLPGLWSVINGTIAFSGLPLSPPAELRARPRAWRALWRHGRIGLFSASAFALPYSRSQARWLGEACVARGLR